MQNILLDFNTIVDPISLLSCLITFRQTHENIYVRAESLIYWYYDENRKIDPNERDHGNLQDKSVLNFASTLCKRNSDDLRLQESNLCLALRLLHHALDEGYISVLDDTLMGEWAAPDKSVSKDELHQMPAFDYIDQNLFTGVKYGNVLFQPDAPFRYRDIAMSLKQNWDSTFGGRTFNATDISINSKSKPFDMGYQAEIMKLIDAEKFRVYTTLLDNPQMLPLISNATQYVVKNKAYEKNVRWFLPKYALGALSLGIYPLIEMLWIIIKNKFDGDRQENK